MFVLGNFVGAIAQLVDVLLQVYTILLIVRVFLSWVNPDPFNPIVQFLTRMTDPVLAPLHRIVPPIGPFDISPIIAIFLIQFLQHFLVRTLNDLSFRLR